MSVSERNEGELSRRDFARLLGTGAAAAGITGATGMLGFAAAATEAPGTRMARAAHAGQAAQGPGTAANGAETVVRLNANENPLGPCPGALAAMREALTSAYRYPFETEGPLLEELAAFHRVGQDNLLLGNGSSEILELSVAAFCSAANPAVVAAPTFEAVLLHANAVGDKAQLVPLTSDYHHDLEKMLAVSDPAGLIYLCNPNNPTGTLTPKAEVRALLAKVPRQTMLLVDEAYYHYADSDDYESVIPLVREHPNLIVTRTFSKVYGMAGLRCGYAVASPAAIKRLNQHQAFNNMNAIALVAARESLKDGEHVTACARGNRETRAATVSALREMGFRVLPSEANFFMVDLRRPAPPVIQSLREQGVAVGRPFPALPTFLRVTVGTSTEMRSFLAAFRHVLAA